jgi:branched-chain amino acid transport system ATP-binding protein
MTTQAPALAAVNVAKDYNGNRVLLDVNISVERGQVHALIGPNGAGKSTLFKIISGEIRPSAGRVELDGEDITGIAPRVLTRRGVGRNFQVPRVFNGLSVAENLTIALEAADRWRKRDSRRDGRWVSAPRPWVREQSLQTLDLLGVPHLLHRPVAELAHGDRKLVELGLTLAQEPTLLLLDEPMAGMSPDEVHRCADVIAKLHRERDLTVLLVEHDMETVFRLASTVNVLAGGVVIASGSPDHVRRDAAVREAYLGKAAS